MINPLKTNRRRDDFISFAINLYRLIILFFNFHTMKIPRIRLIFFRRYVFS